jgi:hypothetical protein
MCGRAVYVVSGDKNTSLRKDRFCFITCFVCMT